MKVLRPAHFVQNSLETLKLSALELICSIDGTVESILNFAKRLAEDKQNLSKVLWRRLVQSLGWGKGAVASYVKLGLAFMAVDVAKLSLVEPRTLFIITSSKKYRAVVDKIKSFVGLVTQQFVEYEMSQCRKQQAATKQEEKPTIWRAQRGGGARSCVIQPIYEPDSFVGTRVQDALDKGELPQSYIRKAVALVEAMESGAIEFKKELLPPQVAEILGINIDDESIEVVEASVVEVNINNENHQDLGVSSVKDASVIPDILTLVVACQSYAEVQAVIEPLDSDLKNEVWSSLSDEEMQRLENLKATQLVVEVAARGKVIGGMEPETLCPRLIFVLSTYLILRVGVFFVVLYCENFFSSRVVYFTRRRPNFYQFVCFILPNTARYFDASASRKQLCNLCSFILAT